jgi:hypothetical protein
MFIPSSGSLGFGRDIEEEGMLTTELPASTGRGMKSIRLLALLLVAAFAVSLTASSHARAAECMSATACSDAAVWQQAIADDSNNKSAWFRATSKQNFINAYEWGQKATFAFYAGDGTAAAWYKAIADDYSRKSVADAKAANDYAAQAQSYVNASQDSINRSEFFGALGEGSDLSIASDGRKCEHTIHHRTDPDPFGSGKPNTYGCEYWNTQVRACDRDVDGHRVKLEWVGNLDYAGHWFPPEGGEDHPWSTAWAPSRGCVDQGIGGGSTVLKFRVCVEHEKCSAWRRGSSGP